MCLQTKEEIAHSVKEELTKSMTSFGFSIIQTLVTDIEPDLKVRAAMNEINAAQRLRCAASHPIQRKPSCASTRQCKRAPSQLCVSVSPTRQFLTALALNRMRFVRKQK